MKKILIILASVVFVLFAAAELYVQSDSFALRIRPLVVDRLKAVLGDDVEIGWVRANFMPMYLEVRDIALYDERGKPAAAIRKIKVYVNPLPLLFKRLSVPSMVFLEPRFIVERAKDGTLNVTPIVERIKKNISRLQAEGPPALRIRLGAIVVNRGKITFDDTMTSAHLEATQLQMNTTINFAGDSMKFALQNAVIRVAAPAFPELTAGLKASVRYENGRFHLDSTQLSTADTAFALSGDIGSLPDAPLDLRLKIRSGPQTLGRFTKFLKGAKKDQGPNVEASAHIHGNVMDPSIEGTLKCFGISYQGVQFPDAALSFSYVSKKLELFGERWKLVRGNQSITINSINAVFGYSDRGLDIKHFDVLAGDLSARITGRADPQRGYDAALTAESGGEGRALSFLTNVPLKGRIAVKGFLTGAFAEPLFDGSVSAGPLAVRGILFDHAEGRLQYRDNKISMVNADIHQRASRYFIDGSVDLAGKAPIFSARAKVIHADVASIVALFYEELPLRLSATGEILFGGTTRDYAGSAHLALEAGSAYGESIQRGDITVSLVKDKISFPQVLLNKGSGIVRGSGWIGFDGSYSAHIESSGVKLGEVELLAGIPVDGYFNLDIGSSGSFSHPRVNASLDMDEIFYNKTSLGGLTAELDLGDGVLNCRTQLADDQASITARLGLSKPYAWNVQAKLNSDAIDLFLAFGEKDLAGRVRMIADGNLTARGNGKDVSSFSGSASFRRLGLTAGDYRIDNDGDAAVTVQAGRLSIQELNFKGPGTKFSVSGGARLMKDLDFSLSGTASLSMLRILYREVEHGDGTAEVKLTVQNAWKRPEVAGELRINNGEIKIKDIPQKFSALQGKFSFDQSRIVVDSLKGEVGGGTMSASGWVQLSGLALRDFSLKTSFENVTVRYPEGLTSTLSGDLYYDGGTAEQSLTGDVAIKRARYDKRVEWKSMLVDIGKGLYQKKKTDVAWIGDTQINIRFHGKDGILLQNNLAKIPLDVDMVIQGTVNQPQLLGRIEARKGMVYFRKNEFKILSGSADFVDPNRMNPILDIQAEIQVRDYRIRLAVSGSAERAVVTLLSDPPLSDSDILALLALGKTSAELKGRGSEVGMSEAASFATGQFQDILESRARSLTGLDRFQVDPYVSTRDTSVPRVTVGKELIQDKLYVTYSSNVGASTPDQIFSIEYVLSRHFSLVGERNELGNTGADVKYRFEFK